MVLVDCGEFCKNAVEHGGSFRARKLHDWFISVTEFMLPQSFCYIYIYYILKKELLGQQNWCPNQYFWNGQDEFNICCILLAATVSDCFNTIFRWFGQNSEVKSASSAKEVDEYLSRHTLNGALPGGVFAYCLVGQRGRIQPKEWQ